MARTQVVAAPVEPHGNNVVALHSNALGNSTTGPCVVEIDLAVIKNQGQLRAALNNVFFQLSGQLPT